MLLFFRKHYGILPTLGLQTLLLIASVCRLLAWLPQLYLGPRRRIASLEVKYNWRTLVISCFRDDAYDYELLHMG